MRQLRYLSQVFLVFVLLAGILPVSFVRAQSTTQVSIEPAAKQDDQNDTASSKVWGSNVAPLSPFAPAPQSAVPTLSGGGGLLTPEPIETGAPPGPINQNEDPTFWVALITIALLAVLLLAGIFLNYRRKAIPH